MGGYERVRLRLGSRLRQVTARWAGGSPLRLVLVVLAATAVPAAPASAAPGDWARAGAAAGLSTPQAIDRAVEQGRLDRQTAALYLAYALKDPGRVPAAYRGDQPFDGTVVILRLREELARMRSAAARSAVRQVLAPPDAGSFCYAFATPLPDQIQTEHFYVEYDAATLNNSPDGLTIDDFVESLEHVWTTEVGSFAWWAPPLAETPPPGGKYHVRIDPAITWPLYGFVANLGKYAGFVGDSPNTAWDDQDAYASCMGLNSDYSLFPGSPRQALDATVAHEFHHAVQFGIGAITGANEPDIHFVEGSATWMEDEAYDSANDNYNYLWPDFHDDMGEHEGNEYSYWVTFRGLTERFGASVPNGGENVMQRFWELISRGQKGQLDALDTALRGRGTTLPNAYHAYAIAVKFNRACGGGYGYPYCFEEGRQYVNGDGTQSGAGETEPHGAIDAAGGAFSGVLADNYSLNWVELPSAGRYRVTLANASDGGKLRLSVICDLGTGFRMKHAGVAVSGRSVRTPGAPFSTSNCNGRPVAVITNQAQTAPNPSASEDRSYTVSVSPA